jgi:hypothetical protein
VRLLEAGRQLDGPGVGPETTAAILDHPLGGSSRLSLNQAVAVEQIATSGRRVDVLVGAAGAGKSTAMAGLRAVWEAQHGPGSVIGLAPSAAAAQVLGDELGIDTDNTAKWLTEHHRHAERLARREQLCQRSAPHSPQIRRQLEQLDREIDHWRLQPGQLVIVDEATLAGTFALDSIVSAAGDSGAKVLLVGDPAQLSGVEAGGAFAMLTRDRGSHAPTLSEGRRFQNRWEAEASLALREGHDHAVDAYLDHDRVVEGTREEVLDALHRAWELDIQQGRTTLMIAGDSATVDDLNRRARAVRVATGHVASEATAIASGQYAGVGDQVVTRHNDRRLTAGRGWVKNGDRWTVTAAHPDGSLTVKTLAGTKQVVLPAEYVSEHVELGYATTAHRAQGRTLDTAHVLVHPTTTREGLYVAATRGRHANHLYVDTSPDADPATGHPGPDAARDGRDVLVAVLHNQSASVSAHDTLRQVSHTARSLATLCDEYQAIAAAAGPAPNWATRSYIGGLVARASALDDPDAQRALDERETAIRTRVEVIAHDALRLQPPWARALGRLPLEPGPRQHWMEALEAIAGYRERWSITSPHRPLGSGQVGLVEQLRHRERASKAVATAVALAAGNDLMAPVATNPAPAPVPERRPSPSI